MKNDENDTKNQRLERLRLGLSKLLTIRYINPIQLLRSVVAKIEGSRFYSSRMYIFIRRNNDFIFIFFKKIFFFIRRGGINEKYDERVEKLGDG